MHNIVLHISIYLFPWLHGRIFYHNGKTLEDPSEIANAFNEYFISIGPSLTNTIDKNKNFRKYLRNASESRL